MSQTPISDAAWHAFNETASAIPFRDEMRKLELELAGLKQRTFLSEAAVTACHSAMLGKVNPKHPAWGVLYAAQDAMATAAPADGGFYGRLAAKATRQRDEADDYILALWRNNQLPAPMPDSLRDRLAAKK